MEKFKAINEEVKRLGIDIKKIGAEIILMAIGAVGLFFIWVTVSIYSVQAKADRVIAVEEKVDYIYKYLIEKK